MSFTPTLHTIEDWLRAYRDDGFTPGRLLREWLSRLSAADPAWITLCSDDLLTKQLGALQGVKPGQLPLYGVPFAVKDNIDVEGWITTAACPAFARQATQTAAVVQRLQAAGAVVIGKTNLDQFATGLVGTRSPYGSVPNTFDPRYISGGSSSGSASVVARGLVPFALGTDTAGSGRVPAGLNHIVGLKPTPGSVPMRGVLPACRTLDVVSVFALTVGDASAVMSLIEGADLEPRFHPPAVRPAWFGTGSRPLRVGVPVNDACDPALGYDVEFQKASKHLSTMGAVAVPIDMTVLDEVAALLYEGPWVAERYAVVRELLDHQPKDLDPTVREVIAKGKSFDARQAFEARYRLAELAARAEPMWNDIDMLMVPTTPTCPTLADVKRDPVKRNSELGRFTNFVNLLGWSALALPFSISASGLPFGVTFIGPAGADAALADWGVRWELSCDQAPGAGLIPARPASAPGAAGIDAEPTIQLAVVGAHLRGLPLHHQLTERRCRFLKSTTTSDRYRLFALANTLPPKPGLIRTDTSGAAIQVEVYEMPQSGVGSFLQGIPYPLGLGNVELEDGQWVKGFVCDPAGLAGAEDITRLGGWRAFIEASRTARV